MELPAPLRQTIDRILENTPLPQLRQAAKTLSERYRSEIRDGRLHMGDEAAVKAYLAQRMPATYAAVRACLDAVAEARPGFSPGSLLDIGAGPGTVLWAAAGLWTDIERATMLEASPAARTMGERLAGASLAARIDWLAGDVTVGRANLEPADLVTVAYVLDELPPPSVARLIERLWALTVDTLLVVEPGTPAGWRRVMDVRAHLVAASAHIVAPCPHHAPCPLAAPDWCHFSRRVARSRLHRLAKEADVPWEDEKFIYLAASRLPPPNLASRVLAPPKSGSGKVLVKLCRSDGNAAERLYSKRDGAAYKKVRRAGWGDRLDD